jgi:hypothetical protein
MGPASKLKSLLKIADILDRLNKANYANFEGITKPCICSKAQFMSLALALGFPHDLGLGLQHLEQVDSSGVDMNFAVSDLSILSNQRRITYNLLHVWRP